MYLDYRPVFPSSEPWEFEGERWHELVFCVLSRAIRSHGLGSNSLARRTTRKLAAAGLLDPHAFSRQSSPDAKDYPERIKRFLVEAGFSESEAIQSVGSIASFADALQREYGGRVQRFLRECGEKVLDDAKGLFRSASIPEQELDYVLRQWLQNALSLPLYLPHSAVTSFCRTHRIGREDLVEIADDLDLNIIAIDDLIVLHDSVEKSGTRGRG